MSPSVRDPVTMETARILLEFNRRACRFLVDGRQTQRSGYRQPGSQLEHFNHQDLLDGRQTQTLDGIPADSQLDHSDHSNLLDGQQTQTSDSSPADSQLDHSDHSGGSNSFGSRQTQTSDSSPADSQPDHSDHSGGSNSLGSRQTEGSNRPQARSRSNRPKRTSHRLKIDEYPPLGATCSATDRFCWNVGYWLADTFGDGIKTDDTALESLAGALLHLTPATHTSRLTPGEAQYVADELKKPENEYRALRARLLIGTALIYEHNLRGNALMAHDSTHLACRPTITNDTFKFCNIGKSQAQMVGYKSDVAFASQVWAQCGKMGYAPADLGAVSRAKEYHPIPEIEAMWPREARRTLYNELVKFYERKNVPHDLRFVIPMTDENLDQMGI